MYSIMRYILLLSLLLLLFLLLLLLCVFLYFPQDPVCPSLARCFLDPQAPMAAACLKFPCRAFPAAAVVVAMASDLVGKAAPDFEIELEDGSKKKLSEFLAEGHRGHLRTKK